MNSLMTAWFHSESMSHTIVHHGPILAFLTRHEISSLHPYPFLVNLQLCKSAFSEVSDSQTQTHTHMFVFVKSGDIPYA